MERVYKKILGYHAENEKNSATHVILSLEELNALNGKIRTLENQYKDGKQEIIKEREKANKRIFKVSEECQQKINSVKSDLNNTNGEIERLNGLNKNLLRISRERANAKRGIKPKKEHDGYILLDSTEYTYQLRIPKKKGYDLRKLSCWKVRIQSVYDASMPFDVIEKNLEEDLLKVFGAKLGISSLINNFENRKLDYINKLWESDERFIFKTSYKQNFKSGFWEVEYLVNTSIVVPSEMLVK